MVGKTKVSLGLARVAPCGIECWKVGLWLEDKPVYKEGRM